MVLVSMVTPSGLSSRWMMNLDGVDMLTRLLVLLEVWASAERLAVEIHHVGAAAGLGRDLVAELVLHHGGQRGYSHTALLASGVSVVNGVGAESSELLRLLSVHSCTSVHNFHLYLHYHTVYIIVKSLTVIYAVW